MMLQKRLFAQDRGVLPFQKIALYTKLPRQIHHLFVRYIQGYIVEWPSYKELSVYANIGCVLDPSPPGCLSCHLSHVYCSVSVTPGEEEHMRTLQAASSAQNLILRAPMTSWRHGRLDSDRFTNCFGVQGYGYGSSVRLSR